MASYTKLSHAISITMHSAVKTTNLFYSVALQRTDLMLLQQVSVTEPDCESLVS